MIDIIIVTYNAKDALQRCIRSLYRHTDQSRFSLTIVDNHSSDKTAHYLEKLGKSVKTITMHKNAGFSAGANAALRVTDNEFVALMDDDVEVTKGWLDTLYTHLECDPRAGIAGCKIVFPNGRIASAEYLVKIFHPYGCNEIDKGQYSYVRACDALAGPCWLMRRSMIERIGYFDERFFPCQHEDIDYCLRARLAGYKIMYAGDAHVIHHHLYRNGGQRQFLDNRRKFIRKWKGPLQRFPLRDASCADRWLWRGFDYFHEHKLKKALLAFRKVARYDKCLSHPSYQAIVYERLGEYKKAIRFFNEWLYRDPQNIAALRGLVSMYKSIGCRKKAVEKAKVLLRYLHQKRMSVRSVYAIS